MSTKMVALALTFPVVLIAAKRTHAQSPTPLSSTTILSSEAAASSDSQDQPRAEDPGVQTANRNTGAGVVSLSAANGSLQFFQNGLARFRAVETVSHSAHVGLGPRFNSISCASCHSQPAAGGSSGAGNPQFTFTNGDQPRVAPDDDTPYFITANGPTREARFPFFFDSDGRVDTDAPDGGVEDLFTVSGRADAGRCVLHQPPYDEAREANNIIFRIPPPIFGDGLVENLDDSTLLHNQAAHLNNRFGIEGTFNHNGNDGTISRFGWKAQNKSLEIFAGEAYNVEMGITNELFTQERPLPEEEQNGNGLPADCLNLSLSGYPEDATNFRAAPGGNQFAANASIPSDVVQFAMFMRMLAPPQPGEVFLDGQPVDADSVNDGAELFSSIGCATCHNPAINSTQPSRITASLSNQPVDAFSDFEIHHMGAGLADNIAQGTAGGDQFRTAPLWGLGQRIFLLHDGRTTDLNSAIQAHQSTGSEANTVIDNFNDLTAFQQQQIMDFLRYL